MSRAVGRHGICWYGTNDILRDTAELRRRDLRSSHLVRALSEDRFAPRPIPPGDPYHHIGVGHFPGGDQVERPTSVCMWLEPGAKKSSSSWFRAQMLALSSTVISRQRS